MLNLLADLPKISCLMVTAPGRIAYVQKSLRCFKDQTYPRKELVVVNEGPVDYQKSIDALISSLGLSDVKTVWLRGEYSLGSLRNISVGLASGELFCQWDDDDFCTPERLATQYAYLASRPWAKVCYLSDQLHYYYQEQQLYWDDWKSYASAGLKALSLIPGTLMSYKKSWYDWGIRYPPARLAEDTWLSNSFVQWHSDEVLLLEGKGYMHVYTQHGTNQVFDRAHHRTISVLRSQYREVVVKHRIEIARSLDYFDFGGTVKVMARDGLVFSHEGRHV